MHTKHSYIRKSIILSILAILLTVCTQAQTAGNISDLKPGTTLTNCHFERVEIAPGEEHVLAQIDGRGMITYFYITDRLHTILDIKERATENKSELVE